MMVRRIGFVLLMCMFFFAFIGCTILSESSYSSSGNKQVSVTSTPLPELDTIPTTPHAVLTSVQVINYVGTSEFMGGVTLSGKPPTILVCKQMTVGEAEHMLYNTIADEKDAPVFLVELQGPFRIANAAPPPSRSSMHVDLPIVNKAYEVFDATNGQVVLWGIISDGPSIPKSAQTAIAQKGLVP